MNIVLSTLNAKYIHASLALRYLKAYAQKDFPEIQLVEFTIHDVPSQVVSDIFQRRPDVVAFSMYIWNVEQTIPIIKMLKQVLPDVVIILGGPEVSYDVSYWMKRLPEVDYIVTGEGEVTFHELLERIRDGAPCNDVLGTVCRVDGTLKIAPPRPKVNLDTLPSPYADDDLPSLVNRIVYFESSRGCPFSCQFCLSSIESGVRYFDLEHVKCELTRLMDAGIKTIKFVDRTFNLKKDYALALFQFLIEHRSPTVFQFEITGDILPPEITDYLAEHAPPGKFRFEIGVQSTNDLTNTLVQRRQDFEKLSRTITHIRNSGRIVQHLDLIAGLPEEDYTSFRKTFNDVFAFEPEELQLGFLKMLRGTGMRARAAQHHYIYQENAPYEILGNNVLNYDDIIRIKQVEDVLDKYWNDNRMRSTVRYLTRQVFPSAFDFFQSFGSYWEGKGWSRIGHQLKDLFLRLSEFLSTVCSDKDLQAARSLMILDYLMAFRLRPHEAWWPERMDKRTTSNLVTAAALHPSLVGEDFAKLGLTAADLQKNAAVHVVPCELQTLLTTGNAMPTPTALFVYYAPGLAKGERPSYFTAPVSILLSAASSLTTC